MVQLSHGFPRLIRMLDPDGIAELEGRLESCAGRSLHCKRDRDGMERVMEYSSRPAPST